MLAMNGFAGFCLVTAVKSAQRVSVERAGKLVVSGSFYRFSQRFAAGEFFASNGGYQSTEFEDESRSIAERAGGDRHVIEQRLRASLENGATDLVNAEEVAPGLSKVQRGLPAFVGSVLLAWWFVMLTCQGEGADIDVQRRRHPMWEWAFSHPVPPGAVFLAEMLMPLAANPVYWGGPLFAGIVYGSAYGAETGMVAGLLVGVPVCVAAGCVGKAMEIAVLLRCAPRSRGGILGLMGWFGYMSLMLSFLGLFFIGKVIPKAAGFLAWFTHVPWPWLGLFVGVRSDGTGSALAGFLACWFAALLLTGCSVWFSVWATQKGLSGNFGSGIEGRVVGRDVQRRPARFGKEPLYRKEMLWFMRDRSAIVQSLLIPVSMAALQLVNLRGLLVRAQGAWNYLGGVAILFGTYFLWVLGPKSLQSEGTALWISLTWPRGLESLLKAKAWLWAMLSTGLVALVLCYAAFVFPAALWKIALIGVAWFVFSRSMAEKSVTLVTIVSSSGESEPVPKGRRWAAQLGMLTFSIGVVTAQWQLAIIGIVYSYITAAAMWQNFRARLPYLYDPWSEEMPLAPTLMHAMISISVLVEVSALVSLPLLALLGREGLGAAQALSYGISAVVVSLFVANFLSERDVRAQDIWYWGAEGKRIEQNEGFARRYGFGDWKGVQGLLTGTAAGLALGIFGLLYQFVLLHLPALDELVKKSREQLAADPDLKVWLGIMAVGFAPFAEEYLFRGLLFRALDREWGGWKAVVGSAAFFAIYHPPLSWIPVGMLGMANAVIFKKTGRLAPAVMLHMAYNAVVVAGWKP